MIRRAILDWIQDVSFYTKSQRALQAAFIVCLGSPGFRTPACSVQRVRSGKHGFIGICVLSLIAAFPVSLGLAQPPTTYAAYHRTASDHLSQSDRPSEGYRYSYRGLGTTIFLTCYHHDAQVVEKAVGQAQTLTREIESVLTDYDAESETRRLTTLANGQAAKVSQHLWATLIASDKWYRLSDGAFDASMGNVTSVWRKARSGKRPPPPSLIDKELRRSGWKLVSLDTDLQTVELAGPVRFDFGGIGKGYVVDQIFDLLNNNGIDCCLVNISGNIRCGTAPPGKTGWRIAVAPLEPNEPPLTHLILEDTSLATSGDLWQYIEIDGVRHSHILDPSTGYGVVGPIAATALCETATDADALATVACILPRHRALELANQTHSPVMIVDKRSTELAIARSDEFPRTSLFGTQE